MNSSLALTALIVIGIPIGILLLLVFERFPIGTYLVAWWNRPEPRLHPEVLEEQRKRELDAAMKVLLFDRRGK